MSDSSEPVAVSVAASDSPHHSISPATTVQLPDFPVELDADSPLNNQPNQLNTLIDQTEQDAEHHHSPATESPADPSAPVVVSQSVSRTGSASTRALVHSHSHSVISSNPNSDPASPASLLLSSTLSPASHSTAARKSKRVSQADSSPILSSQPLPDPLTSPASAIHSWSSLKAWEKSVEDELDEARKDKLPQPKKSSKKPSESIEEIERRRNQKKAEEKRKQEEQREAERKKAARNRKTAKQLEEERRLREEAWNERKRIADERKNAKKLNEMNEKHSQVKKMMMNKLRSEEAPERAKSGGRSALNSREAPQPQAAPAASPSKGRAVVAFAARSRKSSQSDSKSRPSRESRGRDREMTPEVKSKSKRIQRAGNDTENEAEEKDEKNNEPEHEIDHDHDGEAEHHEAGHEAAHDPDHDAEHEKEEEKDYESAVEERERIGAATTEESGAESGRETGRRLAASARREKSEFQQATLIEREQDAEEEERPEEANGNGSEGEADESGSFETEDEAAMSGQIGSEANQPMQHDIQSEPKSRVLPLSLSRAQSPAPDEESLPLTAPSRNSPRNRPHSRDLNLNDSVEIGSHQVPGGGSPAVSARKSSRVTRSDSGYVEAAAPSAAADSETAPEAAVDAPAAPSAVTAESDEAEPADVADDLQLQHLSFDGDSHAAADAAADSDAMEDFENSATIIIESPSNKRIPKQESNESLDGQPANAQEQESQADEKDQSDDKADQVAPAPEDHHEVATSEDQASSESAVDHVPASDNSQSAESAAPAPVLPTAPLARARTSSANHRSPSPPRHSARRIASAGSVAHPLDLSSAIAAPDSSLPVPDTSRSSHRSPRSPRSPRQDTLTPPNLNLTSLPPINDQPALNSPRTGNSSPVAGQSHRSAGSRPESGTSSASVAALNLTRRPSFPRKASETSDGSQSAALPPLSNLPSDLLKRELQALELQKQRIAEELYLREQKEAEERLRALKERELKMQRELEANAAEIRRIERERLLKAAQLAGIPANEVEEQQLSASANFNEAQIHEEIRAIESENERAKARARHRQRTLSRGIDLPLSDSASPRRSEDGSRSPHRQTVLPAVSHSAVSPTRAARAPPSVTSPSHAKPSGIPVLNFRHHRTVGSGEFPPLRASSSATSSPAPSTSSIVPAGSASASVPATVPSSSSAPSTAQLSNRSRSGSNPHHIPALNHTPRKPLISVDTSDSASNSPVQPQGESGAKTPVILTPLAKISQPQLASLNRLKSIAKQKAAVIPVPGSELPPMNSPLLTPIASPSMRAAVAAQGATGSSGLPSPHGSHPPTLNVTQYSSAQLSAPASPYALPPLVSPVNSTKLSKLREAAALKAKKAAEAKVDERIRDNHNSLY